MISPRLELINWRFPRDLAGSEGVFKEGMMETKTNGPNSQNGITTPTQKEKVKFHFQLKYHTSFGQNLYVVGNVEELGAWNARKGKRMNYTFHGVWDLAIDVTLNTGEPFCYKYCILDDRVENGGIPYWDPAPEYKIPNWAPNKTMERLDSWGVGPKMQNIEITGYTGKLYKSPMPFAPMFDPFGNVYQEYFENHIDVILCLSWKKECEKRVGFDLLSKYGRDSFLVLYHPWDDFTMPGDKPAFSKLVDKIHEYLTKGLNIVIHCHAGIGRTGLLLTCFHKRYQKVEKPLEYVRSLIRGAVQTEEQEEFVKKF